MKICYVAPWPHITILTAMVGIIIAFAQRVSLNIAITEMMEHDRSNLECTWEAENSRKVTIDNKKLWPEISEVFILASFFPGYAVMHIPAPIICDKFGSRRPFLVCMFLSSLCVNLLPILANYTHWTVVVGLWLLAGAAQGLLYPAGAHLLQQWTLVNDNRLISAALYSGNWIGMTVGYVISGTIIVISGTWELQFFFWGISGYIYIIFAAIFIFSTPKDNPFIHQEELDTLIINEVEIDHKEVYKNIFKDVACWGLAIGQFGHTVMMTMMVIYLPKFLYTIGFDLQTITMYSCNPYAGMYFCGYFAGFTTNRTLKKHSIGYVRKSNTIAQSITTGLFLIIASYWNCIDMFTLFISTLILCFEGLYYEGLRVNGIDLSIKYHRYINAVTNGIGNLGGILTSCIVACFVTSNKMDEWRITFIIIASIQLITSILFACMGSGNRVKWDPE